VPHDAVSGAKRIAADERVALEPGKDLRFNFVCELIPIALDRPWVLNLGASMDTDL
jgi:hypothetical protein